MDSNRPSFPLFHRFYFIFGPLCCFIAVSETEFATKNCLTDVPVDLKNLWATLGFIFKLEDKSRVGFNPHVQMQLNRFLLITETHPAVLKHPVIV
ncbi:hypothetical protein HanRHA438_Chr04g0202311 [Helianthus annuus]|nr:hypothetical protein HanRHA438_Chr04g0202311 [Helianthus annuus]